MINIVTNVVQTVLNVFDPKPLPVAKHAERLSLDVCVRAGAYVREHEALAAAIRESRAERFLPRIARVRATR